MDHWAALRWQAAQAALGADAASWLCGGGVYDTLDKIANANLEKWKRGGTP